MKKIIITEKDWDLISHLCDTGISEILETIYQDRGVRSGKKTLKDWEALAFKVYKQLEKLPVKK